MLGLRRGAVQVVPYTTAWATLFQSERARLQYALGADALDIQRHSSVLIRCRIIMLPEQLLAFRYPVNRNAAHTGKWSDARAACSPITTSLASRCSAIGAAAKI
jgi:hypothetical protein